MADRIGADGYVAGKLLAAPPALADPNFSGSVVVVLLHNGDGAFGLVLNDPTDLDVAALVPGWERTADPVILRGGPVETGALIGLASIAPGSSVTDARCSPVAGGLGLVHLGDEPSPLLERVRIFVGYSGWAPGQLNDEIAAGGWLVVDAHPDDPFLGERDELWGRVLRRHHGHNPRYARFPDDPERN